MIDAYASQIHYLRAVAPVWKALPPEHRGTLYVSGRLIGIPEADAIGVVPKDMNLMRAGPRVLVASQLDYQGIPACRRAIFMQHGSGQSYGGDSDPGVSRANSYAGGDDQDRTDLFLMPGPHPAQRSRQRYPHIPVAEIGCPAMDRLLITEREGRARKELGAVADHVLTRAAPSRSDAESTSIGAPIIAFAWHWENPLCPETRSALSHFRSALPELAKRYTVIGHGHPRARHLAESVYQPLGIEWADYETVMRLADVLVIDNSSFGFEFLATARPVVWMTPPWYRRDIDHGLRFGPDFKSRPYLEIEQPWQLERAIEDALLGYGVVDVSHVYTYLDGHSAERAAQAIVALDQPARELAEVTS